MSVWVTFIIGSKTVFVLYYVCFASETFFSTRNNFYTQRGIPFINFFKFFLENYILFEVYEYFGIYETLYSTHCNGKRVKKKGGFFSVNEFKVEFSFFYRRSLFRHF